MKKKKVLKKFLKLLVAGEFPDLQLFRKRSLTGIKWEWSPVTNSWERSLAPNCERCGQPWPDPCATRQPSSKQAIRFQNSAGEVITAVIDVPDPVKILGDDWTARPYPQKNEEMVEATTRPEFYCSLCGKLRSSSEIADGLPCSSCTSSDFIEAPPPPPPPPPDDA